MVSTKITFNTGVSQVSVLFPLLFFLFINVSPYLTDIWKKAIVRPHTTICVLTPLYMYLVHPTVILRFLREGLVKLLDGVEDNRHCTVRPGAHQE